ADGGSSRTFGASGSAAASVPLRTRIAVLLPQSKHFVPATIQPLQPTQWPRLELQMAHLTVDSAMRLPQDGQSLSVSTPVRPSSWETAPTLREASFDADQRHQARRAPYPAPATILSRAARRKKRECAEARPGGSRAGRLNENVSRATLRAASRGRSCNEARRTPCRASRRASPGFRSRNACSATVRLASFP